MKTKINNMENNNLNNLPPFYVGQKVVCNSNDHPLITYNKTYEIKSIYRKNCCGDWVVNVGIISHYSIIVCSVCGKNSIHDDFYRASRFSPLQESVFPSLTMSRVIEKERELISMN